ncbi:PAS domain-containing sensor histidine kinase [Methyloversatilis sp.]|uniref:sensor histidine kinase n=1 Tax=Methyloversatilis sp. TaxID=2569862 RepID=UPI0035AFF36B
MSTQAATDDVPDGRPVGARSLAYFNVYRLVIASLLLALVYGVPGELAAGTERDQLFANVVRVYWAFAACVMVGVDRLLRREDVRLTFGVLADIVFLTLLTYAGGGAGTGLPFMHVVVLAFASLMGQGRLALFYAAVASLAMLFQQGMQWVTVGSDAGRFVHVGSISIGYFATAIAVRLLARRVIANEALARERGRDLAEQMRVNERVIRDMDDGVLVVDPNGRVRQANPQAHRLCAPVMPRPVMLADFSPSLAAAMAERADSEREQVFVLDLPARPAALRVRCVPAGGAGGHLVFIEDLARLREQARQIKLAALGRLTASMAHEIRNPLAAICQAAELLQDERRSDILSRLTRIIGDNAQRLDRMVSDVLELGRRDRAEPELLDLPACLRTFVDEFAMREPDVRGRVVIEAAASLRIWFDRGHLHQVLWNLLANALRYAASGAGSVRMTVSGDSEHTMLDIVDNGPGVDEGARAHLFEPFFTTHSRGTGLGLYIARELSDANGATLDFVDNSPGAHFRLRGMNRSLDQAWNGDELSAT